MKLVILDAHHTWTTNGITQVADIPVEITITVAELTRLTILMRQQYQTTREGEILVVRGSLRHLERKVARGMYLEIALP